jgi:hypothetical protein
MYVRVPPFRSPAFRAAPVSSVRRAGHHSNNAEGLNRTVAYFDGLLSNPSEARRLVWKVAL